MSTDPIRSAQERQTAPADGPAVHEGGELVTPPPELVTQWIAQVWHEGTPVQVAASDLHVATQAARWGADQELEACISEIARYPGFEHPELFIEVLRSVRRPLPSGERPPTLAPMSEWLPELRGMFERILCVAMSSGQKPVGHIQLADQLIRALVSWGSLPLPSGEVEP